MMTTNRVSGLLAVLIGAVAVCAMAGSDGAAAVPDRETTTKLKQVTLPELTLREAPIRDVMDFISGAYVAQRRKAGATNDVLNIVLDRSVQDNEVKITLQVSNVSFHDALDWCCRVAGLSFTVEENAVVIHAPPDKAATGAYLVDTRVIPAEGTNTCLVEFRVSRGNKDGSTTLVSCPKITVVLGSEGRMEVADQESKNGLFCTVLVKEEDKGGLSARTHVTVREGGKVVCDTAQSITVPSKPANAMPR